MTEHTAATPAPESKKPETTAVAAPPPKPPTRHKSHRIVRLIRRHQRILTFIGALIVFATFVIKDAFRENLRDIVDSLGRFEGLYLIRAEVRTARRELQQVAAEIRPEEMSPAETEVISRREYLENKFENQSQEYLQLLPLLTNLRTLADLLGNSYELQQTETEVTRDGGELMRTYEGMISENEDTVSLNQELTIITDRFEENLNVVNHHIDAEAPVYVAKAQTLAWATAYRYRVATWASWFLYALGWGLGLAGRMVGVEGLGDGGD